MPSSKLGDEYDSDAHIAEMEAERLAIAIANLSSTTDTSPPHLKIMRAEKRLVELKKYGPRHPAIAVASAAVADFVKSYRASLPQIPKLREIGTLFNQCPYCNAALSPRPKRKTICKACGSAIHVKKRPIDGESALMTEKNLTEVEEDWMNDFHAKERKALESRIHQRT